MSRRFKSHPLQHLGTDVSYTAIRNPQAARGSKREIEDAATNERASVIDGDDDAASAMGHADLGAERQGPMRCCQVIPIECRTARCLALGIPIIGGLSRKDSIERSHARAISRWLLFVWRSSRRLIRLGLVESPRRRLCLRLRNDGPSVGEILCCSRVRVQSDPSRDCRNRYHSDEKMHCRPHEQIEDQTHNAGS